MADTGINTHRNANLELARKVATDPAFGQTLEAAVNNKIATSYDPVLVLWALQKTYGYGLDGFPKPGSKEDEGNLTDQYTDYVVDEKTGKSKTRKGSFYTDFFDGTPMGRFINDKLAQLTEALKLNGDISKVTDPTIADKMKNGDTLWLESEQERLTKQKSAGRGIVVRGVKLQFAIDRLEETVKGLEMDYDSYEDNNGVAQLKHTPQCCIMAGPEKKHGIKRLTVTQVVQLGSDDTIAAIKAGGSTYAQVLNALKREGNSGTGNQANKIPAIQTVNNLHDHLLNMGNFFDPNGKDFDDHVTMLKRFLGAKNKEENVLLVGNLLEGMKEAFLPYRPLFSMLLDKQAKAGTDIEEQYNKAQANGEAVAG